MDCMAKWVKGSRGLKLTGLD